MTTLHRSEEAEEAPTIAIFLTLAELQELCLSPVDSLREKARMALKCETLDFSEPRLKNREQGEPLTTQDVALLMDWPAATAAQALLSMERRGLVFSRPTPKYESQVWERLPPRAVIGEHICGPANATLSSDRAAK